MIIATFYIVITLVILVFAFYWALWWRRSISANTENLHGTKIYKVDIHNRKLKPFKIQNRQYASRAKWSSLDAKLAQYPPQMKKGVAIAIHRLEKGSEYEQFSFMFSPRSNKKEKLKFTCKFHSMQDDSDFIFSVTWKAVSQLINDSLSKNKLKANDIIESKYKSKGFVAFNINKNSDSEKKLLSIVSRMRGFDHTPYFIEKNMVIFVLFENSLNKVNKRLSKFIKKMKAQGFTRGANHLFDGSAYLSSNKIDNPTNLGMLVKTLDFLISISIESGNNFVSYKKDLVKDEFKKFADASHSFRLVTQSANVDVKKIPVKSYKSKRKRIEYSYPTINSINDKLLSRILRNPNNRNNIIDAHARKIGINEEVEKPTLLDVNSNWLIANHEELRFKEAIYIINIHGEKHLPHLKTIVEKLSADDFYFALKVSKYDEQIASFIKNINVKFIVVDKEVWNGKNVVTSEALLKLMAINEVAQSKKIKLIYESPPEFVNDDIASKIGLSFFY